ncbi:protein phosphatase 2C-like domain-containing protein 1 [Nycticebus coucang]|uniref:protein phosphatase 2C-like domain-containing protein 1 n=1 Tax=Nycticebus coucang TaxID=9470 RepID=UPI00234DCD38|nr:protein phosphatase 2C-like domain-containing protein 1 [Nycticebus coucang]
MQDCKLLWVNQVFWKSKEWNMKKSIFELYEEIALSFRNKSIRDKSITSSRNDEAYEQQAYENVITLPCSICKNEISLPRIFLHRKQHAALATMGLQWMRGRRPPPSILSIQRHFLISNLLSSSTLNEKILHKINNAFELICKERTPAYYRIFDSVNESSTYSQKICHLLIKGVAICEDRNSSWKTDMKDKFTVVNNFGTRRNVCFFGLFDGHYGPSAAELTAMELPVLLLHQLSKFDPSYQMTPEEQQLVNSFHTVFREDYVAIEDLFSSINKRTRGMRQKYENIHKAFAMAFWRMDRLLRLGRKEVSRVQWSGCSAVTCILEGNIESPSAHKNGRKNNKCDGLAKSSSSQMPKIISGTLHVANAGTVQAVLCRNGKDFCLTKEHTTRNINERRRLLQDGAMISPHEPCGLLEGQIKTTRGLGFHGNLKLKKFIIPAPQTISVPIDDLCQFLILATNGLWEVLDTKEVTALVMTTFDVYKEIYHSTIENKSSPSNEPLLFSTSKASITKSESDIHVLFQYKPQPKEHVLTTNSKKNLSNSKCSNNFICNPPNVDTFPPEVTHHELCSEKETDRSPSVNGVQKNKKDSGTKSFYEGAAEYVSRELVSAALAAGSRDNVTVMVIFLNGSEYQFLT